MYVNEGNWSVFAEKVVGERDAAHEEIARLRKENLALRVKIERLQNPDIRDLDRLHCGEGI